MSKESTAGTTERLGIQQIGTPGVGAASEVKFIAPERFFVSRVEKPVIQKTGEIFTMQAGGPGDQEDLTLSVIRQAIQGGMAIGLSPDDVASFLRDVAKLEVPEGLPKVDADLLNAAADKLKSDES